MGLEETARPVWSCAASYEERIAPLLDVIGRDAEAALHRVSAAACFAKSGDLSRAANLYRAALAGPLSDPTVGFSSACSCPRTDGPREWCYVHSDACGIDDE